ncbi:MAG: YbaB/EbfC family nucleoid-associated protein [Candidatus Puniceispirillaceae bacterium]
MLKNMGGMMKKLQDMQAKMQQMQQDIEQSSFSAQSGGGAVFVTLTGKGLLTHISIKPDAVDPEDIELLEDLIKLAVNDARAQADKAMADAMSELTGGLPLPPGMKLPF